MGSLYPDQETNSSLTSEAATPTGGLPVVSNIKFTPGGKGQIATMTSPTGVLMDENSSKSILANMQKLLEEKPFENFQNDLQKMYAWTKHDKEPMFRQLEEQRQQKEAQRYNIMQSMEALKANQGTLRNQAASLVSPQTGTAGTATGTADGAPTQAQGPINAATQAEINRLINEEGNVTAAQALRKRAFDEYNAASARKQFSADMDAPVEGVMFEGKPLPMTRRQFVQWTESNPAIARALMKQNPGLAETINAVATEADPAIAARQAGLPVISGERSNNKQWELYDAWVAGGRKGNPVARPGTSSHEFKRGLDVDMNKATDKDIAWLKANDYYQPDWATNKSSGKYDPNHWEKMPVSKAKAELAVSKENTPITGATKEEYTANVKLQSDLKNAANQAFIKSQYEPLAEKVNAQSEDVILAQDVLEAIKTGNYGPGSGINQGVMRAAKALGIGESEKDAQQYLNNLTITRAKELFKASGARAAMGSQFTAGESENFGKTLADITDPKEYIKNVYQLKIAMAKMNAEYLQYLDDHPTDMVGAKKQWKASGRREEILRENVDYLREREEKQKVKPEAAPKESKPKKTISFNDLQKG